MNSRERRRIEAEKHNAKREADAAKQKRWKELLDGAEPANDDERFLLAQHRARKVRAQKTAALVYGLGAGMPQLFIGR